LHYYLAVQAARVGYRVCEIPVARRYPATGPIPTKITPLKGNIQVLGCLLKASTHGYDPDKVGR
jgi:dolichol-phosphate mannosyltransferase